MTDAHHPRIEEAFRKYFHRAPVPEDEDDDSSDKKLSSAEKHEFEIIVCHANVIRYWMCRYVCHSHIRFHSNVSACRLELTFPLLLAAHCSFHPKRGSDTALSIAP